MDPGPSAELKSLPALPREAFGNPIANKSAEVGHMSGLPNTLMIKRALVAKDLR